MSFKLLKQVISHLRKQSSCPSCKSRFPEDSIYVLATTVPTPNGISSGLFFIICPKCATQAFVMVEVTNITAQLKKEYIRVQTKSASGRAISVNEVLDMHNFLKNWQGDVKELFQEL